MAKHTLRYERNAVKISQSCILSCLQRICVALLLFLATFKVDCTSLQAGIYWKKFHPLLIIKPLCCYTKIFFWCWSANIPRHSLCYMISLLCTQFFVVCLRGFYFRHIMCMMILSYSSMIRGEEIYLGYDEFFGCINFCGKIFWSIGFVAFSFINYWKYIRKKIHSLGLLTSFKAFEREFAARSPSASDVIYFHCHSLIFYVKTSSRMISVFRYFFDMVFTRSQE